MAAPIMTAGPSRPPLPPTPSVAPVLTILGRIVRVEIYPPRRPMAVIVSVTPPLSMDSEKWRASSQAISKPMGMVTK